jgi:hypothetical protein
MALVKRLVKGSPLTFQEGDDNLDYLEGLPRIVDVTGVTGSIIQRDNGNSITDSINSIVLGINNTISNAYDICNILGGKDNIISDGYSSTISGGYRNEIDGGAFNNIGGGDINTISGGYFNVIGGGLSNDITGAIGVATIAGGVRNTASAYRGTIIGGDEGLASGNSSTVLGGARNTASGGGSIASGSLSVSNRNTQISHSPGAFTTFGDTQIIDLVATRFTTNATPVNMVLRNFNINTTTNNSGTVISVPNKNILSGTILITAVNNGGTNFLQFKRSFIISTVSDTTTLNDIQTIGTDVNTSGTWAVAITADDTNKALQIQVTGAASTSIRWMAHIQANEQRIP